MAHAWQFERIFVLAAMGAATTALAGPPATLPTPEPGRTTAPAGEYKAARLVLVDLLGAKTDFTLDGGFRGGKLAVAGRHSHQEIVGQVQLAGDVISGKVPVSPSSSIPGTIYGDYMLTISATVAADGSVSGTYTGDVRPVFNEKADAKPVSGKVTGFVRSEAQLATLQGGFAKNADWPTWGGPGGNFAATPTGAKLVDDMAQARLLWRSEETLPQGPGSLYTLRAPGRALFARTGGGGASPVFGDGKVFVNYLEPCPASGLEQRWVDAVDKARQDGVTKGQYTATELPQYTRMKFTFRADYVLLAIDAVSGKTLWKTTFPSAGPNSQSHKTGPMNLTPLYAGGKIFAMTHGGTLNAMDAASGKHLWATQVAGPGPAGTRGWNNAPNIIGGVIVLSDQASTLVGVAPDSGKILWKLLGGAHGNLGITNTWTHGGKEYALTVGSNGAMKLVDPASGKVLWEHPVVDAGKSLTIRNDIALIYSGGGDAGDDDEKKSAAPGGTPATSGAHCLAIKLSLDKPEQLWKIPCPWVSTHCDPVASPQGHVLLSGREENRIVDLQTGKELAAWKGDGGANEGHADVMEDRFLIAHDGSHGSQAMSMLLDSAEKFSGLGAKQYTFQHPQTSSYHNRPMTRALVDGRIFIRGFDGIYCYDLRPSR